MTQIFLVDDDDLIREMLGRHLVQRHYRVRQFSSPDEVLDALSGSRPQLVISDVQMPGMTGLELAERLRQNGLTCPLLFITGRPTEEVRCRAEALDAVGIWEKSMRDIASFTALVDSVMAPKVLDGALELDRLRMGFLTEVSHEIRTPLTAVRIALEGLLAEATQPLTRDQQTLIDIGFRNLDRVIGVVERQLALLHVTLGEVTLVRRLTTLREVLEDGVRRDETAILTADQTDAVLFTDPERLRGIVQHIRRTGKGVGLEVAQAADSGEIVMTFADTNLGESDDGYVFGAQTGAAVDLEGRACCRMIELLGGAIEIDDTGPRQATRITLPVVPPYRRYCDFVAPLKTLRELARLSGKTTALIGCRILDPNARQAREWSHEFYQRSLVTIADGDVLVRGREPGQYYLGLLDRNSDEIEHILRFLGGPIQAGPGEWLLAELHHTLLPGDSYAEDVLLALESS